MALAPTALEELTSVMNGAGVDTDERSVWKKSHDYYWFSPRMETMLHDLTADAAIKVQSVEQLKDVVRWAVRHRVPLVPRVGATSNFGQCVPHYGGVMVDLSAMDQIVGWESDTVTCQAGVRCQPLENAARERGWEMKNYPSTWVRGSIGGFACAGSGGIGAMSHGFMHENRMIVGAKLLTVEEEPRIIEWEGADEAMQLLHSCGTLGFLIEVTIQLTPKKSWDQLIIMGKDLESFFEWGLEIAQDTSLTMRMMGLLEWPLPDYCKPIRKFLDPDQHILVIDVEASDAERLQERAKAAGWTVAWHMPAHEPRRAPMVSDFVQGHTTLWALKAEKRLGSLAAFLDPSCWRDQRNALLEAFPENPFIMSVDFRRFEGNVTPQTSYLFPYTTDEDLQARMDFVDAQKLTRHNLHDPYIDTKFHKDQVARKIELKREFDPYGLMNPGKLKSFPYEPAAKEG